MVNFYSRSSRNFFRLRRNVEIKDANAADTPKQTHPGEASVPPPRQTANAGRPRNRGPAGVPRPEGRHTLGIFEVRMRKAPPESQAQPPESPVCFEPATPTEPDPPGPVRPISRPECPRRRGCKRTAPENMRNPCFSYRGIHRSPLAAPPLTPPRSLLPGEQSTAPCGKQATRHRKGEGDHDRTEDAGTGRTEGNPPGRRPGRPASRCQRPCHRSSARSRRCSRRFR